MDNFMDKLAQKLTAQEMIKANSAADAAELEHLQNQLAQYDACLQEMRKLSLKNVETTDKIGQLLDESIQKIKAIEEGHEEKEQVKNLIQEQAQALEEIKKELTSGLTDKEFIQKGIEDLKASMDEVFTKVDDCVHKENVKVYRNVQAVVVEESKKVTDNVDEKTKKLFGKSKGVFIIALITMLAALANIVINLLVYFK